MITLVKVISTELNEITQRLVKVLRYGKRDIKTPYEASPFGTDSNCPPGWIAVHCETGDKGETVIVGYLNKKQLVDVGEHKIYSTDKDGKIQQTYILLTNTGIIELGGKVDNAVRYLALNTALQQEAALINTELGKIATAITNLGGAYTPTPIVLNISASKINEVKTP